MGTPSFTLAENLRRLQRALKAWNWEVFGDVRTQLVDIRKKIDLLGIDSQQGNGDNEVQELRKLKEDMARLLRWEADLLFQKTREKFLNEGDRNTRFFQALIKDRRQRNTIKISNPDGSMVTDSTELLNGAVQHFQGLFTAIPYSLQDDLFDH